MLTVPGKEPRSRFGQSARVEKHRPPMPRPKPDLRPQPQRPQPQRSQPEVVDPIWLLKGIGLTLLAALVCGYLAFCLLFYQGQWQLVLHPTRTSSSPPSIAGITYEVVHFAPDESAVPQLTGWWIPAAPAARYVQTTVLFLPGADGSLVDAVPTLAALHAIGINIFAFDYRGYGQSADTRPNQLNMMHDADSAWQYLNVSRAIPAQQIVLYGVDVGASLATHLALTHASIPALILDSPNGDLLAAVQRDPRSHLVPLKLLFRERFPLAKPLAGLKTRKLLLLRSYAGKKTYKNTSNPAIEVEIDPASANYRPIVAAFLNQYLNHSAAQP